MIYKELKVIWIMVLEAGKSKSLEASLWHLVKFSCLLHYEMMLGIK